jgi:ribulose-5-phosphate 4-epimerase/fuculose-1-phosphate aldolase
VPGTEDFLINPYGMMFDEITASNLVKIDLGRQDPRRPARHRRERSRLRHP